MSVQAEWSEHIYTKGCMVALENWLPGNLYTVAVVFIVISLLQVCMRACVRAYMCVCVSLTDVCVCDDQMVGIYLAKTLISDIEKARFNY